MKKLLLIYTCISCVLVYAQQIPLPYFEEWIGTPNQYEDGVAYYADNRILVKSVTLQNNKPQTVFYERKNAHKYQEVSTDISHRVKEQHNGYTIVPLIQATYLRIEQENQVKSIALPEKALYHTVCVTEKHIFVIGNIEKNAYFVCLDKAGNLEYEYTFNYSHHNQIKSIAEDKDGHLYLAGYIEQSINNTFDAWIAKLSPQQQLLWSKLYGTDKGTDEFYRIEITPNGLLCSGLTYRKGSYDTYILHTDTNGTFGSIADTPVYSYMNKKTLNMPKKK